MRNLAFRQQAGAILFVFHSKVELPLHGWWVSFQRMTAFVDIIFQKKA